MAQAEDWQRYQHGAALVESKRWGTHLDRGSRQQRTPAGQVLRYLRRADDLTNGALRWGILSNGQRWRLYYAGARSVAEQFFEMDLPAALDDDRALKRFVLLFRPQAFAIGASGQSLHGTILSEGRRYEERVAANLSDMVFHQVFPQLARALAAAAGGATLAEYAMRRSPCSTASCSSSMRQRWLGKLSGTMPAPPRPLKLVPAVPPQTATGGTDRLVEEPSAESGHTPATPSPAAPPDTKPPAAAKPPEPPAAPPLSEAAKPPAEPPAEAAPAAKPPTAAKPPEPLPEAAPDEPPPAAKPPAPDNPSPAPPAGSIVFDGHISL